MAGCWSDVGTCEYLRITDARTHHFDDSGNSFGGGVNVGYSWQPHGRKFVFGPVFDLNFMDDEALRSFAGGTSISSTMKSVVSAQFRAGVLAEPRVLIYGLTGISVADQKLRIAFGGPVTDESQNTTGFSLGGGAEFKLGGSGKPSSAFVEYQHMWWDKARLSAPVASPLYNYTWDRDSDIVKGGFRLGF